MFLPGKSQGRGTLVGCRLWGRTESDTTEDLAAAMLIFPEQVMKMTFGPQMKYNWHIWYKTDWGIQPQHIYIYSLKTYIQLEHSNYIQ